MSCTVASPSPRAQPSSALEPAARRRATTTAVALALCVGAASGCAPLGSGTGDVTVDEVATWGESVGAGDDALLDARLAVEDGCVYVTDDFGTRWLPVFSSDLVGWDGETLSVPGGSYTDGDVVALAGGALVEDAPDDWNPPDGLHVPAACVTTNVWSATR
ncbi:hypothetical protein [Cellulosimicrobium marinum]|uniref:hypothetical protein n=1 Tax=Cellulosimicrobium marinum TaxID=1638992 RepID=UPI001E4B1C15|nr:hypothetical protein [Cellulosimicrobium marinum]MCB7135951.1 hypothetical protein [Cellulosimicrobium marinum]